MTDISEMAWSNEKLRCALLTIGSGPVATKTYDALKRLVDLRCVVLSQKRRKQSRLAVLRDFGVWYVAQTAITKFVNRLRRQFILPRDIEQQGIRLAIWSGKDDEEHVAALLQKLDIDLVIVCGFQHILGKRLIDSVRYCFNMHSSLLPHYRGAEPVTWGLIFHEQSYGITVHVLDEGIDTGDIILQEKVAAPSLPFQAAVELRQARLVVPILEGLIGQLKAGELKRRRQGIGSYYPLPSLANRRKFRQS